MVAIESKKIKKKQSFPLRTVAASQINDKLTVSRVSYLALETISTVADARAEGINFSLSNQCVDQKSRLAGQELSHYHPRSKCNPDYLLL